MNKKERQRFELMQRTKLSTCFAVFTGSDFPINPVSSTVLNDRVGYYAYGSFNNAECKALIDDAYKRDSYVIDGTSIVRNVPTGSAGVAQGDTEQKVFKFNADFQLRMKNNTSQTVLIELFEVQCMDSDNSSALAEMRLRYHESYVLNTGVVAGTDPQDITLAFDHHWATPGVKANLDAWKRTGSTYSICLNPGDEVTQGFKHNFKFDYAPSAAATTYGKGAQAIIFRVQGSLSHSDADPRKVHFSAAQVDVQLTRKVSVWQKDAVFTGQRRIVNNAHSAFTDDVVAGDATQHAQTV